MEADPHRPADEAAAVRRYTEVAYFIFHQTLGWQGMRDMAEVWRAIGREDLYETWRPVADRLKAAIDAGMRGAVQSLDDGSLFVPRALYLEEAAYPFITETKIGSYWNLVMPYAFASGYWPMDGPEVGRILDYMHGYGGLFLGLLRFNYYPTPIGSYRADGLPGYYTTGDDNVYLPSYLRMLAAQDAADRQVLSFYGKLAHGMTRNTFVAGEGSTIGARPGVAYRSCYGTPSSANNTAFLLNLRLMPCASPSTATRARRRGCFWRTPRRGMSWRTARRLPWTGAHVFWGGELSDCVASGGGARGGAGDAAGSRCGFGGSAAVADSYAVPDGSGDGGRRRGRV